GVESCAPGAAMVVSSGRRGTRVAEAAADLRAAAEWLARFHGQARTGAERWDAMADEVEGRLAAYQNRFAAADDEVHLLRLARARSTALSAATVPAVWRHNDFGPWNVHRSGSRITVIDWELGGADERERTGPPLCDLLYFATYWYQRVRHFQGHG